MKRRFYAFLRLSSVFFAEVCSRSSPEALLPRNFALLRTVYGTHTLFLASIAFQRGLRVDRRKIYLLGVALGMYEFRITKVYFEPGELLYAFGVNLLNVLRIGFLRHAFMSFLVPFYLSAGFSVGFRGFGKFLDRSIPAAAFLYGLLAGINLAPRTLVLANPAAFRALAYVLRPARADPEELVANPKYSAALLAFFYVLYGLTRNADLLPRNPAAYAIALSFYLVVLYGLSLPAEPLISQAEPLELTPRLAAKYAAIFEIFGIALRLLAEFAYAIVFALLVLIILGSVPASIRLTKKALSRRA